RYGLVPLERVEINEGNKLLAAQLDDIVFAFSQTLVELRITAVFGVNEPIRIGGGRVCEEIETNPAVSVSLEGLTLLVLCGWSALTFHPDIFYSTPKLDILTIETIYDDNDGYYIPSHEELDGSFGIEEQALSDDAVIQYSLPRLRPYWEWDWYLPVLRRLRLASEFAYRFQFKMLQGCPRLEELDLLMLVEEDPPSRVITEKDFFAPRIYPFDHDHDNNVDESKDQRIELFMLKELRMEGRWIMSDATFMEFSAQDTLRMMDWHEITLGGLVKAIKTMSSRKLKTVTIDLERPSDDEAEELGLTLVSEDANKANLLHFRIQFDSSAASKISAVYALSHPPK
ncbi:hypothetical protein BGZ47_002655, partial [Haplosporangium gracile]